MLDRGWSSGVDLIVQSGLNVLGRQVVGLIGCDCCKYDIRSCRSCWARCEVKTRVALSRLGAHRINDGGTCGWLNQSCVALQRLGWAGHGKLVVMGCWGYATCAKKRFDFEVYEISFIADTLLLPAYCWNFFVTGECSWYCYQSSQRNLWRHQ